MGLPETGERGAAGCCNHERLTDEVRAVYGVNLRNLIYRAIMELLLIRHGQSYNNARPEHERIEDPPLTVVGQEQCQRLTGNPDVTQAELIITSPFLRALQSADILQRALELPVVVWRDIHEQGGCYAGYIPGQYEGRPGLTRQEIQRLFPNFSIEPTIGENGWWQSKPYETFGAARVRARRVLQQFETQLVPNFRKVAMICHGDFLRALMLEAAPDALALEQVWGPIYNASVTLIRYHSPPCCVYWNSVTHLPAELVT